MPQSITATCGSEFSIVMRAPNGYTWHLHSQSAGLRAIGDAERTLVQSNRFTEQSLRELAQIIDIQGRAGAQHYSRETIYAAIRDLFNQAVLAAKTDLIPRFSPSTLGPFDDPDNRHHDAFIIERYPFLAVNEGTYAVVAQLRGIGEDSEPVTQWDTALVTITKPQNQATGTAA